RNFSWGTYLPRTSKQPVNGVERISPIGPQRKTQKAAEISTATSEIPMLRPNSHGSITLLVISSNIRNMPIVPSGGHQPVKAARLRVIGNNAAIQMPMYGTNRKSPASNPQRMA